MTRPDRVRAAGTALWRPGPDGEREVAVVHRPRYDDWSLPKGKLARGEHPAAGAVRETREETGASVVLGNRLGTSSYRVLLRAKWTPKTVTWWAARWTGGHFEPGPEVDELRWLPLPQAQELLTAGRDVEVLHALAATPAHGETVLLVRHGRAGKRSAWPGPDAERPLDARGLAQAQGLCDLLDLWGPVRLVAAAPQRCAETLRPLAARLGLTVEVEPLLGDEGVERDVMGALARLQELAEPDRPLVVCSQGEALRALLAALGQDEQTAKGSGWVLTLSGDALVGLDPLRLDER